MLQQVGAALLVVLGDPPPRREVEAVVVSVINRLTWRAAAGDEVLAEDLWAVLRGEPRGGRVVPVDLDMLAAVLEGDLAISGGGFLDLRTGHVHDEAATDPGMVGQDAVLDVDAEPGRWLRVDRVGSSAGWQDMVAFAEAQPGRVLRQRLQRATEGRGAFRRFRDVIHDHDHDLAARWTAFATDRQLGRARAYLAEHGIRAG